MAPRSGSPRLQLGRPAGDPLLVGNPQGVRGSVFLSSPPLVHRVGGRCRLLPPAGTALRRGSASLACLGATQDCVDHGSLDRDPFGTSVRTGARSAGPPAIVDPAHEGGTTDPRTSILDRDHNLRRRRPRRFNLDSLRRHRSPAPARHPNTGPGRVAVAARLRADGTVRRVADADAPLPDHDRAGRGAARLPGVGRVPTPRPGPAAHAGGAAGPRVDVDAGTYRARLAGRDEVLPRQR